MKFLTKNDTILEIDYGTEATIRDFRPKNLIHLAFIFFPKSEGKVQNSKSQELKENKIEIINHF